MDHCSDVATLRDHRVWVELLASEVSREDEIEGVLA